MLLIMAMSSESASGWPENKASGFASLASFPGLCHPSISVFANTGGGNGCVTSGGVGQAHVHTDILKLYVGTGTGMAGQTMARFFSSRLVQLGAIYAHLMRILIPGLKSGRLAV